MKIGVAGLSGRMGQLVVAAARAAGHDVVGGVARAPASDKPAPASGVPSLPLDTLAAQADAVIDFTHASTVQPHAQTLAAVGHSAWILGTTGLSAADDTAVTAAAARIPVVAAANFGPGINLLLAIARQLGAALPAEDYDAEIIEMHHRQKVDAPSGTALALGRAVAEGRGVALDQVMQSGRHGHTGPRPPGAIGFAALRGGQVVGEHTLLFAATGEQIALTHRAIDRAAFAAGAVRAAAWSHGKPPGRYTMTDVMGLAA